MYEFSDADEVNPLVAEWIFGRVPVPGRNGFFWSREDGGGIGEPCPNFVESPEAQKFLRSEMESRGWSLTIDPVPSDAQAEIGKMTTAVFKGARGTFESTRAFESQAVCLAALATVGVSFVGDN